MSCNKTFKKNRTQSISKCLQSLKKQTSHKFEKLEAIKQVSEKYENKYEDAMDLDLCYPKHKSECQGFSLTPEINENLNNTLYVLDSDKMSISHTIGEKDKNILSLNKGEKIFQNNAPLNSVTKTVKPSTEKLEATDKIKMTVKL